MKILWITKNRDFKHTTNNIFLRLGCDIFYSETAYADFNSIEKIEALSRVFTLVLFDESMSHTEIMVCMANINEKFDLIFRKTVLPLSEIEEKEWKSKGIDFLLNNDVEMDEIREFLSEFNKKKKQRKEQNGNLYDIHSFKFTNRELRIYKYLLESKHYVVSKNELCKVVFNDEITASNLSALSFCINNMRRKMEKHGFKSDIIKTMRKKGYQLNPQYFLG